MHAGGGSRQSATECNLKWSGGPKDRLNITLGFVPADLESGKEVGRWPDLTVIWIPLIIGGNRLIRLVIRLKDTHHARVSLFQGI